MITWEYIKGLPSGAVGLIAAVFIYLSLSRLIQIKEKWWAKGLMFVGCWITSFTIIYIGDWFNLPCVMALLLLVVWVTCKGSGLKRFTLGLMFACTILAFNGLYDNCIGFAAHYSQNDSFYDNMYLIGRLLFAVFLYLSIRFRKTESNFELSAPLWRLMLSLSLPPLGIMLSLILLRSPYQTLGATVIADAALFLVVMLSFAGLLRALSVLERQQRLEWESTLALQNQSYYEAMEAQQFEVRRLRHDMINHLQALLALPEQQKNDYIMGMLDNPAFVQTLSWCGDPTINAVLTVKENLIRQKGIHFSVRIDIPHALPFEKADICAIFANALDNAAENCIKLDEPLRKIHLEAKMGKGILAVKIENTCPDASVSKGQLPKTTKKDAKNHGIGLKSIQKTVNKYNGSIEIKQEKQSFILFLYLPMEI
ncbi:MAG: GHKL domain-containing protein [Lachnospiraceae bacterium]|nr:GHKL domain-containing protein [Lachnospiraceae bacterium]